MVGVASRGRLIGHPLGIAGPVGRWLANHPRRHRLPEGCERQTLFGFLWAALVRSGGHAIHFAFPAEDETLRVIYMDTDYVGYAASAAIDTSNAAVRLGGWKIERMSRSAER